MNKKILSGILSLLMLITGSIGNMAFAETYADEIKFVDANGDVVTSVPDLGKVYIDTETDGVTEIFATYDSTNNRMLNAYVNEGIEVNEFAEGSYVKAFAFENLENIKPVTECKTVELPATEKQLLVTYANGISDQNFDAGKANDTSVKYGNAKYSAKRSKTREKGTPISLPEGKSMADYNIVKVRYYAGNLDYDRFCLCLMSTNEYGAYNTLENRYLYAVVKPTQIGWNVAEISVDEMLKCNTWNDPATENIDESERLPLTGVTHLAIMTDQSKKVFEVKEDIPNYSKDSTYIPSLYIDSVWAESVEPTTVIDFGENDIWNTLGTTAQFSKSTEQAYGTKTQSAKVTATTGNATGFFDLKDINFETDWSDYEAIKIRYYTPTAGLVPAVYLASAQNWVTSSGLDGTAGAYRIKSGTYANKKSNKTGWNTVIFKLPANDVTTNSDFDYYGTKGKLSISNIPYLLIPNYHPAQYWNESSKPYDNITGLYIDSIELVSEVTLEDATIIDFSDNYTWDVLGAMTQFSKDTTVGYDTKTQSAKVTYSTNNTTGYIDLAAIGFTTDWSEYDTINIRYRTSNTEYVPPVRLTTVESWVAGEHSTTANAYKPKSGIYTSKKATTADEWTVVSFDLANDFEKRHKNNDLISWGNVPYMQIATGNLKAIWNNDSAVTYAKWNGTDNIYIDSIWLSK